MTTHNENLTRVQQELWHLINDEYVERILEAMIEKMKKVEDSFEYIKQWRQEAKAYIPDDQKYEENYWIAAYILYTNEKYLKYLFEDFDELDSIRQEISKLWDEIKDLRHKEEKLKKRIKNLRDKLPPLCKNKENKVEKYLLYELDKCKKDLEDMIEMHRKKRERYFYLNDKLYYHLLPEIIKRAEQLVAS